MALRWNKNLGLGLRHRLLSSGGWSGKVSLYRWTSESRPLCGFTECAGPVEDSLAKHTAAILRPRYGSIQGPGGGFRGATSLSPLQAAARGPLLLGGFVGDSLKAATGDRLVKSKEQLKRETSMTSQADGSQDASTHSRPASSDGREVNSNPVDVPVALANGSNVQWPDIKCRRSPSASSCNGTSPLEEGERFWA